MVPPPDPQQLLIYYLIWCCHHQRITHYSIGRHRVGSRNKLDDVLLEVFRLDKRYCYLFNIHQRQHLKRNISYEVLTSSSSEFSLARYFAAYLKLKSELKSGDHEIAVWTEATFRKRDLKVQQMVELVEDCSGMLDLLENGVRGVRRYRVKSSTVLEEKLLKSVDPLYKLAEKIAQFLFAKLPIGPNNTSNRIYGWLVEHVFENNSFKREFLAEDSMLSEKTLRFRGYLEAKLDQQFKRKQIEDFQLHRIEKPPYSTHIAIYVKDHHITSDTQKREWNIQNTTTIADVQRFFASLVFYTNVPTSQTLETVIHQRCSFNEGVYNNLKRFFRSGIMLSEKQINAIFKLDEFKKNKPVWTNEDLQFKLESLMQLEAGLSQFCAAKSSRLMIVEAAVSVRLTLGRIGRVVEELIPSDRFICVKNSKSELNRLLSILKDLKSVLDEVPVIIVPCIEDKNFLSKIKSFTKFCQAVLVADHSYAMDGDSTIYTDNYSFEDFSNDIKDNLLSKCVLLQGREYLLTALLDDTCLNTIPMEAVINWNTCEQIIIGSQGCSKDQRAYFIQRDLYSESGETVNYRKDHFDCITIVSGEPGIGKSVLLEIMSQEIQHKQCVSIIVNCRSESNLLFQKQDILEFLLELFEIKKVDHFQRFLLTLLVKEKRIHLFLDDFDELCESKTALGWIKNNGFHFVVIAVRPNLEAFLTINLHNFQFCYLKPFSKTDQLMFLKHRWENVCDASKLENVIQSYQIVFKEDFLKIPQNFKIAAILQEEAHFTINAESVPKIVEAFIEKKFSLRANQVFNICNRAHEIALKALRASFEEDHVKLAFALECGLEADREVVSKLYPFGLLRFEGDKVTFIDSSFQEFYVVKFLLTHYVKQKYFNRIMEKVLSDFDRSRMVKFLDHHISSVDFRNELFGDPKVLECFKSKQLRPNQRLCEVKVGQFNVFFEMVFSEEQLLECIYLSIFKFQFNVFEVIYDSLPNNLLNNIMFKFCTDDANPNIINLSTISEENVIVLLEILIKKHTKDLFKRVITNFTPDEPDFVTTAIEKGLKRVIELLFYINQSIASQEEADCLQDYVEQRWREYLRHAIVNNRIEIVVLVLTCVAKKYHPRVIKAFLMKQLVFHALAQICQNVDESALEIVQLIVGFCEDNLSDYDLSSMVSRKWEGSTLRELVDRVSCNRLRTVFENLF